MINQPEIFSEQVNFKKIILKFLDFKWFFAITIGLSIIVAFFYNKYTPRTYKNSTTILISTNKNTSQFLKSQTFMDGLDLFNEKNNIDNEIGIITSFENVQKTVNNLNFQVSYFAERDIFLNKIFNNPPVDITRELYKNSPIQVNIDASKPQPIYLRFDV
ncbi:MAG TPA: Wzz/FepE/Etk N-terminal domain-containing protein, partial [Bacteroidales bacterium]|nr:Wzz/FepE/Etk N-terminal domain-containing protein [Bacteroidales bacterium]